MAVAIQTVTSQKSGEAPAEPENVDTKRLGGSLALPRIHTLFENVLQTLANTGSLAKK